MAGRLKYFLACATLSIHHKITRSPDMLSEDVLLLHDNTSCILLTKLKNLWKSSSRKSGVTYILPKFGIQWIIYFRNSIPYSNFHISKWKESHLWNKFLFRHWCENSRELAQWAGMGFDQAALNQLDLWSDKYLNIFLWFSGSVIGSMPHNYNLYYLSIVNKKIFPL